MLSKVFWILFGTDKAIYSWFYVKFKLAGAIFGMGPLAGAFLYLLMLAWLYSYYQDMKKAGAKK